MSRYIRQPGASSFDTFDTDRSAKSEWDVVYECYGWTERYSTIVPRFEIDTSSYSAFKLVVAGYCNALSARTFWLTNNTGSLYAGRYYPGCYSTYTYQSFSGCAPIATRNGVAYPTFIDEVLTANTSTIEIYPGENNSIGWRGEQITPISCCYCDFGGRGVSCQSWDSIKYLEFCVESQTGLEPTSPNSSWHVYGKRRI